MAGRKRARDVVLPCSGGKHRVRLARGRRFWARAKCPVCRARVDPWKWQRILGWIGNLASPVSTRAVDRVAWMGSLAFLLLITLATGLIWLLGDLWWPATVLLFGPRWVFCLPLVVLLPLALLRDRALVPVLLLGAWLCVFPFMGFEIGLLSFLGPQEGGQTIRVVSFNAQGGRSSTYSPATLLQAWEADIVAVQECSGWFREDLSQTLGWSFDARSGQCLVSRYEILGVEEMERNVLESAGGAGVVTTYELDFGGTPLFVTNLHLETPRAGFELLRSGRIWRGIQKVREKSHLRDIELRQAHSWADRYRGEHLVMGDFNTPVESRAFRAAWGGWKNAFSEAGRGFGGTRLNGWIRVRIDHILASDGFEVVRAWTGEETGSDHLPIGADLRIRGDLLQDTFDSIRADSLSNR